jgi:hypothetical protein
MIRNVAHKLTAVAGGCAIAALLVTSTVADARDTLHKFPLESAIAKAQASGQLAPGIKLFFGKQKYPKPTAQLGPTRTNKKTNFFNKSDQEGCEWTFISSMAALTAYAQRVGGNAVVNIRSNYKNIEFSSETEYECGAGNVTGGTAFIGDVVKLP